jgi:serine/threonine protein kinase
VLGYCIHEDTRLLVYELMQNGSLETQLHGPSNGSALSWYIRLKIALDAARGLEHLHEHCNPLIIHRDIKSSNILLDSDFNAKVKSRYVLTFDFIY